MTSFRVRSCSFLLCLLHIVLTRGTGQGTSRSASAQHQGGQQTVVVSGATASQASRAGSSASPQRIAASSHYGQAARASQVGFIFGVNSCLSPPDELLTSCSLPPPKRTLPAYQDVVDAVCIPLEHQGCRNSFSRYLHFLEKVYLIFLHFSSFKFHVPDFSPFFIYLIFLHERLFFIFTEKNPV